MSIEDGARMTYVEAIEEIAKFRERLAEALGFLKRCDTKDEIISTGRLTELQIANARAAGTMYVEPGGGRGWVVRSSGPAPYWYGQQEAKERIQQAEQRVATLEEALRELLDYHDKYAWERKLGLKARAALTESAEEPTP